MANPDLPSEFFDWISNCHSAGVRSPIGAATR
jgi:hypothetical protein